MFFRIASPKNNPEGKKKVVPNFLLNDVSILYLPLTEDGSQRDWSFKSIDVALNDEDKFPLIEKTINAGLKNVFLVPGFYESVNSLSVRTFLHDYLERGDHNVFLLDYSVMGKILYTRSFACLNLMSDRVVRAMRCMEELGLICPKDFHIVGNSLGAHLGALISRKLGMARRLTGLDPAGPLFKIDFISKRVRICKEDAQFVDIIHTDMKKFGLRGKLGHADFYPNGGVGFQPGCKRSFDLNFFSHKRFCSHWRCWIYYCESLNNEDAFPAAAADSWEDFKKGCTREVVPMGYTTPAGTCGNYYLQTTDKHPYGKGKDGLKYCK